MSQTLTHELRAILLATGDPQRLLGAVLNQALFLTKAVRGLIFDRDQVVKSVGYTHQEKIQAWRALYPLLQRENGNIARCSQPFFSDIASESTEALPFGVAGIIGESAADVAVLGVECMAPLEPETVGHFADWLQVAAVPVAVSHSYDRLSKTMRREPLRLRDLPLDSLEVLPNIKELEEILIAHALRRNDNNKVRAAAALGISREGLRRKLLRL